MKTAHFAALGAVVCSIGLALVARGDAPPEQYSIFQSQTPTIRDTKSLLEWERFPEDNRLAGDAGSDGGMWAPRQTFSNAHIRCEKLAGGWRLPTVKELLTLVDENPHQVYVDGSTPNLFVDRNAFPTTLPEPYWTSSPQSGSLSWTVDFGSGQPQPINPSLTLLNRCVR